MARKPKPEDFHIGEPVEAEEIADALAAFGEILVMHNRRRSFDEALAEWEYQNGMTGR